MRCSSPKLIWPHRSIEWCDTHEEAPISVPCGKCIPCLIAKRQEWTFRLEQEFKYSHGALFVTLTYDYKHYPSKGSLDKRHVQLFLKRLRKRDGTNKIRYYCVGEYGSRGGRPHYHLLLFGCSESTVRLSWQDSKGCPIGIVHCGTVTPASIAYCTKYVIQKDYEVDPEKEKPFAIMSRRYGLGGHYLTDEMVKWHRENAANYAVRDGVKVRLSRFYRSKIWYKEEEREIISSASKLFSVQNLEKENSYYKKKHPLTWEKYMREAQVAEISLVRQKIQFSQKF